MIAVLDYGIGNLRSAEKALQFVGADARLVTDANTARRADGVVLPGVGAFGACALALGAHGLDEVVVEAVSAGKPTLAVCVGMQLLFDSSEESPGVAGLGILPGRVRRLPPGVRRPQMQWNLVTPVGSAPGQLVEKEEWFYFVHGYVAQPDEASDVAATCDYGGTMAAAVSRGTLFATQFHPEKSGNAGLALLERFARTCAS